MRYVNLRLTYLLTYLLTQCSVVNVHNDYSQLVTRSLTTVDRSGLGPATCCQLNNSSIPVFFYINRCILH